MSFFDAVYGFALTLLVANVDPPDASAWKDFRALASSGLGPQLLGLALSFTVIAVFWRINVRLMARLTGLVGVTTFVNLATVGLVILIPFTTQGISDPQTSHLALPTAAYALNVALVSITQIVVFQVARARGLERAATPRRQNVLELFRAMVTPTVFLISVPLAFAFGTDVAKYCWASALVLGPLAGRFAERGMSHASASRGRR